MAAFAKFDPWAELERWKGEAAKVAKPAKPQGVSANLSNFSNFSRGGIAEPKDAPTAAAKGAPTWSAADWRVFYEERAAIAEHDGGLDRAEAECRAFEAAVVHWMNCNPPTDPGPDHCAGCGGPLGHIGRDSVPVIRGNGEHVWVHHRCHHHLMARRYAEAVEALAAMGLTPPTGWRARR